MPWWAWIVLGIGLLAVELFFVDAQFYLVFIGLSAAAVGLLGLAGVHLPEWSQWLAFAVLALVFAGFIYPLASHWVFGGGWLTGALEGALLALYLWLALKSAQEHPL